MTTTATRISRAAGGVALAAAAALLGAACGGTAPPSSGSAPPQSASPSAALPAGMTAYGFSQVAASVSFSPGTAAHLQGGNVTVTVPANALSAPATFQLLLGDTAYWQTLAPAGQTVVAAFAFRVVDSASGAEITKFQAPVVAAITDSRIVASSHYLDTTRAQPPTVVANPKGPVITGTTLTHGNIGDGVGWLVTS